VDFANEPDCLPRPGEESHSPPGQELLAVITGQRIEPLDDAPDVGARPFGPVDGQAPDRLTFHVIAAERRSLAGDPLGQEGMAVD